MSWIARLGYKPNKSDLITSDRYLIWSSLLIDKVQQEHGVDF